MKRNKLGNISKENLEITRQKKYQRKVKSMPVEQQTLLVENKKAPAKQSEHPVSVKKKK